MIISRYLKSFNIGSDIPIINAVDILRNKRLSLPNYSISVLPSNMVDDAFFEITPEYNVPKNCIGNDLYIMYNGSQTTQIIETDTTPFYFGNGTSLEFNFWTTFTNLDSSAFTLGSLWLSVYQYSTENQINLIQFNFASDGNDNFVSIPQNPPYWDYLYYPLDPVGQYTSLNLRLYHTGSTIKYYINDTLIGESDNPFNGLVNPSMEIDFTPPNVDDYLEIMRSKYKWTSRDYNFL